MLVQLASLKNTKVKLDLLPDINMLWYKIVEKGIRGGICHCIYRYAKANNMTYYAKNKESLYNQFWDANN